MTTFTFKNYCRGGAGGGFSVESSALRYRARWLMNQPCEAIVTLNDSAFAEAQQYLVTGGSTYLGWGGAALEIEHPLNTDVFRGVITRAVSLPRLGVVELHCRDWLYQLDTQRIVYDTREDLDGSGLRESVPYYMSGTAEHGILQTGANFDLYDTVAGWSENDWTGTTHYLLFSHKMAGAGTFWHGVESGSITNGSDAATDYADSWFFDNAIWAINATANGDLVEVDCKFYCYIDKTKITQIDIEIVWAVDPAKCISFYMQLYDFTDTAWETVWNASTLTASRTAYEEVTINDIAGLLGDTSSDFLHPADEYVYLKILCQSDAAQKADFGIKYLRVTFHYEGATANTTAYTIDDDGDNYIRVSEDLIAADIDKHCPYSITQVITAYVADLVGTYDTAQALDYSTDLVASTNTVARHFHYMTPLEILNQLALADGTEFWLDMDLHLHWNDAYSTVGAYNVTDSVVLYWIRPAIHLDELGNDIVVVGQRYTDHQTTGTANDANSKSYYGTHTIVEENPHIFHEKDASDHATTLKNRYKDPVYQLAFAMNGTTLNSVVHAAWLGEVVEIDSTDLNLADDYYVITEIRYDSLLGVTEYYLTPRNTSGLFAPRRIEDGTRWIRDNIGHSHRHANFAPLHTETWS